MGWLGFGLLLTLGLGVLLVLFLGLDSLVDISGLDLYEFSCSDDWNSVFCLEESSERWGVFSSMTNFFSLRRRYLNHLRICLLFILALLASSRYFSGRGLVHWRKADSRISSSGLVRTRLF